jgi:hypothetical protein
MSTKIVPTLDKDGHPFCAMTIDEFVNHIRTFEEPHIRVIAFKVSFLLPYSTMTTQRSQMTGMRANAGQRAAYVKALNHTPVVGGLRT